MSGFGSGSTTAVLDTLGRRRRSRSSAITHVANTTTTNGGNSTASRRRRDAENLRLRLVVGGTDVGTGGALGGGSDVETGGALSGGMLGGIGSGVVSRMAWLEGSAGTGGSVSVAVFCDSAFCDSVLCASVFCGFAATGGRMIVSNPPLACSGTNSVSSFERRRASAPLTVVGGSLSAGEESSVSAGRSTNVCVLSR
jgi:hypothetical protein